MNHPSPTREEIDDVIALHRGNIKLLQQLDVYHVRVSKDGKVLEFWPKDQHSPTTFLPILE